MISFPEENKEFSSIFLLIGRTPGEKQSRSFAAEIVKTSYMRAVMQEMIMLLGVAGIEGAFEKKGAGMLPALRYEDFATLRPQYSAVSWRVTAGKLVKTRHIVKTLRDGKIAFQLTRLGMETFLSLFVIGKPPEPHQTWMLCFLQSLPGEASSWVEARRLLRQRGFVAFQPQAFVRFQGQYDGELSQSLMKLGFLVSCVPVQSDQAQPAGLEELVESASTGILSIERSLEEASKESHLLLSESEKKKSLHTKDKQRIGKSIISGLTVLSELPPGWYLRKERFEASRLYALRIRDLAVFAFSRL